jgi:hypothetical protein
VCKLARPLLWVFELFLNVSKKNDLMMSWRFRRLQWQLAVWTFFRAEIIQNAKYERSGCPAFALYSEYVVLNTSSYCSTSKPATGQGVVVFFAW